MRVFITICLMLLGFSSTAFAFWDVQNSGEDVFGNVNVTATSVGENGSLIRFECGSSSDPFFAFLLRDSSGEIPSIPAEFLHVDQNGNRHQTNGVLGSWNEKYVAVKVTDINALKRVAEHMLVAKKAISVGIRIPNTDAKFADTFSSRGSTKAGKTVLTHCLQE